MSLVANQAEPPQLQERRVLEAFHLNDIVAAAAASAAMVVAIISPTFPRAELVLDAGEGHDDDHVTHEMVRRGQLSTVVVEGEARFAQIADSVDVHDSVGQGRRAVTVTVAVGVATIAASPSSFPPSKPSVSKHLQLQMPPHLLGPMLQQRVRDDDERRAARHQVALEDDSLALVGREEAPVALVQPGLEGVDVAAEELEQIERDVRGQGPPDVPLERREGGEPIVLVRGGDVPLELAVQVRNVRGIAGASGHPIPQGLHGLQNLHPKNRVEPHQLPMLVDAVLVEEFGRLDRHTSSRGGDVGQQGNRLAQTGSVAQYAATEGAEFRIGVLGPVHGL